MKYLIILAIVGFATGCKRSEIDIKPDQVVKKPAVKGVGDDRFLDMKHLPPNAVVHTMKFKKGDVLPDGRIADSDIELKRVEILGKGPGEKKPDPEDIGPK